MKHSVIKRRVALGAAAAAMVMVAACDFSVNNPGPIDDANLQGENLQQPLTRRSITAGMRRSLADAIDEILYWGAAVTYEINPAGSTGSFGIPTQVQFGILRDDIISGDWDAAQVARWTAEEGIRRFTAAAVPEDSMFAVAYLWAGYANRLLGENFCDAVFDGGPKEDFKNFFTRAEGHFTEALRIATAVDKANLISAARAGRASVRAYLATYNGNDQATWNAALADANGVTSNTFAWVMPYSDQDQNQYNFLYWAQGGTPYRAHTEWSTYHEWYYRSVRDARAKYNVVATASNRLSLAAVPGATTIGVDSVQVLRLASNAWIAVDTGATQEIRQIASADTAAKTVSLRKALAFAHVGGRAVANLTLGDAAVDKLGGRVPFLPQQKHTARNAAINLSSGWEMRLLEAEYELAVNNDAAAATAKMNIRRTAPANQGGLGLTPLPVTNLTAAWTNLKAERALELWVEARRLGDLRRWSVAGTPGTTFDGLWQDTNLDGTPEQVETMTSPSVRSACFPIGRGETQTNPNLQGGG